MRRNVVIGMFIGVIGGYYGNLISGGIGRSFNELLLGLFIAFLLSFFIYHQFGIKIDRWFVNIFAALGAGLFVSFFDGPVVLAIVLGVISSLIIWPIIHRIYTPIAAFTSEKPRMALIVILIMVLILMAPILIWAYSRNILKEISIVIAVIAIPILAMIIPRLVRTI